MTKLAFAFVQSRSRRWSRGCRRSEKQKILAIIWIVQYKPVYSIEQVQ